jgi:hypothetical protein
VLRKQRRNRSPFALHRSVSADFRPSDPHCTRGASASPVHHNEKRCFRAQTQQQYRVPANIHIRHAHIPRASPATPTAPDLHDVSPHKMVLPHPARPCTAICASATHYARPARRLQLGLSAAISSAADAFGSRRKTRRMHRKAPPLHATPLGMPRRRGNEQDCLTRTHATQNRRGKKERERELKEETG